MQNTKLWIFWYYTHHFQKYDTGLLQSTVFYKHEVLKRTHRTRKEIPEFLYWPVYWRHQTWGYTWGYSSFCRPHMRKQTQTKRVHDLHVPCGISCVFIFTLRPQYIRTWQTTVILITRKTRIPLIGAPCWDKDGASSGISGLYLWKKPQFCSLKSIALHQFSQRPR